MGNPKYFLAFGSVAASSSSPKNSWARIADELPQPRARHCSPSRYAGKHQGETPRHVPGNSLRCRRQPFPGGRPRTPAGHLAAEHRTSPERRFVDHPGARPPGNRARHRCNGPSPAADVGGRQRRGEPVGTAGGRCAACPTRSPRRPVDSRQRATLRNCRPVPQPASRMRSAGPGRKDAPGVPVIHADDRIRRLVVGVGPTIITLARSDMPDGLGTFAHFRTQPPLGCVARTTLPAASRPSCCKQAFARREISPPQSPPLGGKQLAINPPRWGGSNWQSISPAGGEATGNQSPPLGGKQLAINPPPLGGRSG